MNHYVGYMSEMAHRSYVMEEWADPIVWSGYIDPYTGRPLEAEDLPILMNYRAN
jgi:hypothetical protein